MIEIVLALVDKLIDDVNVIVRAKNVQRCLDAVLIQRLQLLDFLEHGPVLTGFDPQCLEVHFAILVRGLVVMMPSYCLISSFAEVAFKEACMTIEDQFLDPVSLQESIDRGDWHVTIVLARRRLLLVLLASLVHVMTIASRRAYIVAMMACD